MLPSRRAALLAAASFAFGSIALAPTQGRAKEPYKPEVGQQGKDVVWVPTPDEVVQKMLDMAQVTAADYLIDLGSGDGKIAIAAAKRGARAKGVEYNPEMVALSKRNARAAGVPKVEFVRADIFKIDFSGADVLTLYLLPELNERLRPRILDMKPGTRVVSHQFAMGDWEPDEVATIDHKRALFWRVPAKVEGRWTVQMDGDNGQHTLTLHLRQRYQKVEGQTIWDGTSRPLADVALSGTQLRFTVTDANGAVHRFEGQAQPGGQLQGTVTTDNGVARNFQARRT